MAINVMDEEDFRRAAVAGATCRDLRNAFVWTSAAEWPCPVGNSTGPGNGCVILYCKLCNGTLSNDEPGTVSDHGNEEATMLPDEITKYIAMMYVDWKLWHDSDRKVD